MDKEINQIISEMKDVVANNTYQEGRLRTRSQLPVAQKEPTIDLKPDQAKGVKKSIRKAKLNPILTRKKGYKGQSDDEDELIEEIPEDEPIPEPPAAKSVELAVNSEEQIRNLSSQVVGTFLYKPMVPLPNLAPYIQRVIEIRVGREYMCKSNKAYRQRNFWGSDNYTSESDIVCILQHNSMFGINELPPDKIAGVAVYCRVTKGRNSYQSTLRNGIRSRKLGAFEGCSIRPESYKMLDTLGQIEELIQMTKMMPEIVPTSFKKTIPTNIKRIIVPPETEIMFNLSLEPAYKFSLPAFADYGWDQSQRTSNILYDNVLYFETNEERYELTKEDEKGITYRLSQVLMPFEKDSVFMSKHKVPLDNQYLTVIFPSVKWNEFKWSENCTLYIKGITIQDIVNFKYFPLRNL